MSKFLHRPGLLPIYSITFISRTILWIDLWLLYSWAFYDVLEFMFYGIVFIYLFECHLIIYVMYICSIVFDYLWKYVYMYISGLLLSCFQVVMS